MSSYKGLIYQDQMLVFYIKTGLPGYCATGGAVLFHHDR